MGQDEGRGFPHQSPQTLLGSAWHPTLCAFASGARVSLYLRCRCPWSGFDDLVSFTFCQHCHDESLPGACEPELRELLYGDASGSSGLVSLQRVDRSGKYPPNFRNLPTVQNRTRFRTCGRNCERNICTIGSSHHLISWLKSSARVWVS